MYHLWQTPDNALKSLSPNMLRTLEQHILSSLKIVVHFIHCHLHIFLKPAPLLQLFPYPIRWEEEQLENQVLQVDPQGPLQGWPGRNCDATS